MKTVKKLFSLLLVAVLLVAAIPFQASATGESSGTQPLPRKIIFREAAGSSVKIGEAAIDASTNKMNGTIPTITSATHNHIAWDINGQRTTNDIANVTFNNDFAWITNNDATIEYLNIYPILEPKGHTHQYDTTPSQTVDATCIAEGKKIFVCTNTVGLTDGMSCDVEKVETIAKVAHTYGSWEVTTPASNTAAGVETRRCITPGCVAYETRPINQQATTVTLKETEGNSADQTVNLLIGQTIGNLPGVPDIPGRRFVGWFSQESFGGEQLVSGATYTGLYNTYYARYVDDVNSSATEVTVYARFFSGNVKQSDMYLGKLTVERYSNLLTNLNANRNTFINRIFGVYDSNDYEVKDGFYMNVSDSKVTDSTQVVSGNTSVYIRVDAKNSAEANVLLYVHNKAGEAAVRLYDMPGYVAGNTVTSAAVQNFLKAQTGKTYTVAGMYEQSAWEQLVAGYKADAVTTVTVPANGTLKIHVVLSNYSSSSSITTKPTDSTNPATGDTIMMTVGIMALSAAAVVTLMQLRKRKMI